MALGSGLVCLWGGGAVGDTVHVNNQPMIVLLVSFRTGGCIRGRVGLGEGGKASLHTCFSCSPSHAALLEPLVADSPRHPSHLLHPRSSVADLHQSR